MRNKSSVTCFLILFALFGAIFAPCRVVNAVGANPGVLANIASRAQVGTGDDVVIAGFIITGTGTKTLVIRGMGPSIPLPGNLADPTLVLYDGNGAVLQTNNNWRDTQESLIQATGLAPGNDFESAIHRILAPGVYSAVLAGNNKGTGIGSIEIYDTSGTAQLANLSTRAQVGTGNDVLIGGLLVRYTTTAVIRAIGPSLTQYGIQGALADPTLELRDANGGLIASNNNWQDTQGPEIQANGLALTNPAESAILTNLAPGGYTAIVQGVNSSTGMGMVEVYAIPDKITMSPNPFYSASNTGNSPTINWTSATSHQIWRNAPNTAQGGQLMPGTTTKSAGSHSFSIPIPGSASNGQKYYVVDANVPDTVSRGYRATVTFAVTLSGPPAGSFPRSFVAWANASNLVGLEDPTATLARHDLVWMQPAFFGWWWTNPADYRSETLEFFPGTAAHPIPTLRSLNPNIKILAVLQHYSLYSDELPIDHAWWLRVGGQRVPSPFGGNQFLLNQDLPALQTHITQQAIRIWNSGQFDGIFMDHYWPLQAQGYGPNVLLTILNNIRNAIGNGPLIVVNANENILPSSIITKVNGVFMESGSMNTANDWTAVKNALLYNETYALSPRANCLETNGPRNDARMRATTCLSLIFSNGYALFSDVGNHEHNWYHPFWSNHSLGTANSNSYTMGTAFARDFQNGTAVWNPIGGSQVTVTFLEMRTRQSDGTRAVQFTHSANNGDIYTK